VQTVPVEFTNVPIGLAIGAQSVDSLQVWLRGTDFIFDSVKLADLVARCDLAHAHAGVNVVHLDAAIFEAPPGVRVEGLAPHDLRVTLTASTP
jgi:hypothetical protein